VEVDVRFRYILYKERLGEQLGRSWVLFQHNNNYTQIIEISWDSLTNLSE
jgi:DNA modification methylase